MKTELQDEASPVLRDLTKTKTLQREKPHKSHSLYESIWCRVFMASSEKELKQLKG
jgi:hypothetical protein